MHGQFVYGEIGGGRTFVSREGFWPAPTRPDILAVDFPILTE